MGWNSLDLTMTEDSTSVLWWPIVAFSKVHKVCGVRPQPFSKIFSWSIKAKYHVEPPWEGGTKVYINGLGHMTKMTATPIYGKNLETSFLEQKVL